RESSTNAFDSGSFKRDGTLHRIDPPARCSPARAIMKVRSHRHELIVVGAGSGGYAAARTVRDFGCDVALVDTGPLGGLCILRGCMPSKALLASSDALQDARDAGALGIRIASATADMPFIAARKRALVKDFADYRIAGIEEFP